MILSFGNKAPIIFLSVGISMVVAGSVIAYKSKRVFGDSVSLTEHTHGVILETQKVLSLVKDIQLGGRGYIITGDSTLLEAVNKSIPLVFKVIQNLKIVTNDNPDQALRVDSVHAIASLFIDHIGQYITLRKKSGFQAASEMLAKGKGKYYLNSIKSLLKQIQTVEYALLQYRKDVNQKSLAVLSRVFTFLFCSLALFIIVIFFYIRYNIKAKGEIQKAKETLQKSLKIISDYKYALDESTIVSITDQRGLIKHVNENFCKISKYKIDELIGQDHSIINSSYHTREFIQELWTTIGNGKIWRGELRNKAKDGTFYWEDTTIIPFLNELGQPHQYIAIGADITVRKDIKEESLKNEIRFRNTLDKMLEGVEILSFDCTYLYVNDAYEKQVRYSKEELLGHTIMEKFPGIEKTAIFKAIQKCLIERIAIHMEDEFVFPDRKCWFEISFQPIPEGIFILSVDTTERKLAAEKLGQSEDRFRSLIENSYDIVSIIDKDFKLIYRSPASARITGWTDEEIEKSGSVDLTHPDDIQKLKQSLADVLNNPGVPFKINFRTRHKDGHYVFLEGVLRNMIQNDSIRGIVSNFRDVTETYKAEERIRESEKKFRGLIENSYEIVAITDEKFTPLYRSPSAKRITGWNDQDRDEMGWLDQYHPDDIDRLKDMMKVILNSPGIPVPVKLRLKHRDGHYLHMEGKATNMLHNDSIKGIIMNFRDVTETKEAEERIRQSEKIYRTIASSIPGSVICILDKDYRYLLVEGDMLESLGYSKEKLLGNKVHDVVTSDRLGEVLPLFLRVFQGETFSVENSSPTNYDTVSRFVPLRDEDNDVFAAMVVVFDISELKRAQRAISELNVTLEQRIKDRTLELEMVNKELESFSYSVAHDLRTPLRAISGYSNMLEEDYSTQLDGEGNRLLNEVKNNAKKMGVLIDDLLNFSKLGRKQIQKSRIDMNVLTNASLHDLHLGDDYPGKITIHDLHPVIADPSLIAHVMTNLLGNAVKYSQKKIKPTIEISSKLKGADIVYSIKDNGVGFDMAYANKIFGVFQRLHSDEEFEGTGVGLAIVQRVVHRHGGKTWADGQVDQGATFYFSLPKISEDKVKNDQLANTNILTDEY